MMCRLIMIMNSLQCILHNFNECIETDKTKCTRYIDHFQWKFMSVSLESIELRFMFLSLIFIPRTKVQHIIGFLETCMARQYRMYCYVDQSN